MSEETIRYFSGSGAVYEKITLGGLKSVSWTKNGEELIDAAYVSKARALELKESYRNFETLRRDRGKVFLESSLEVTDRHGSNSPGGIMVYLDKKGEVLVGGPIVKREPPFLAPSR